MATRNQVLSLFGASPEQILEQRRREQAAEVLKQRDPFQRAGGAIGVGLARLFGGEPAEVTRQRELYSQLEGVNFENPEQMRAAAASLAPQFPDRALQLLGMAEQSEARQQQIATSAAQETKAGFTTAPRFVGYQDVYGKDMMGQSVVVGKKPLYENTPLPLEDYEDYINRKGAYADWYPKEGEVMPGPTSTSTAIPENAIRFNTGVGAPVALVGEEYFIITDEGTLGPRVENIRDLGGVVDPQRTTEDSVSSAPQQRKAQREAQETVTEPSTTTTSRGQMGRNLSPQAVREEEEEIKQRSNRRRSNAR